MVRWLVLFGMMLLFFCSLLAQTPEHKEPEPYLDDQAYAVYAALLPNEWIWKSQKAEHLIIQAETEAYESPAAVSDLCVKLEGDSVATFSPVLEDYVRANRTPKRLMRTFPIDKHYSLVTKATLRSLFKRGVSGWADFYVRYPRSGGYLWVSAVGFNAEKTRAMVHIDYGCGALCGGGAYHFLEKRDGKWIPARITGRTCVWGS